MGHHKKRIFISFLALFLLLNTFIPVSASEIKTNRSFATTEGVFYKDISLKDKNLNQAIKVLEINANDPNTFVKMGMPTPINKLERTTTQALRHHKEGHYVVGAMNASFFHLGTPMNLVAQNNTLIHAGEVYKENSKYVHEPIAFGMNQQGKGIIDYYQLDMNFVHNGKQYPITSTNKSRGVNEMILYTSIFPHKTTNTNIYGTEVVVTLPSKFSMEFGTKVTGVVQAKRDKLDTKTAPLAIPENGFVLSGNGISSDILANVQVGDEITLSIDIDDKWKNSQFMLASGPLLVNNGKAIMTMDPRSANASQRAPRTAVAINKTGDKVYFITVDGRQPGYSNGMTIKEFGEYLESLGVYRALNLDGGGSATLAVRFPGSDKISIANKPSDGFERAVSTMLMAVSTAPLQIFTDVKLNHWAHDSIISLYKRNIINGYPDGSFKPEHSITRTEAAIMFTREFGLNTSNIKDTDNPYKDVKKSDRYYKEIVAATKAGLFQGVGDKRFNPNDNLTRGELAVLLQRAYNIASSEKAHFKDVTKKHFAYYAINGLAEANLAEGYPGGYYKPDDPVKRAEFSEFLYRMD